MTAQANPHVRFLRALQSGLFRDHGRHFYIFIGVGRRASRDTGTGVKEYLLAVDGGPPTTVPASPVQHTLGLPLTGLAAGRHRITIVAVDYAGNRSSPATRSFNLH